MFVNLCVHSYFSLLMSSISIDDIINFALKNKQKYVCLTDFNNMYGAMEFYNKALENNLKPIIGLHVVYENEDLYLIAKDNSGYRNLLKISSKIMTNQQYNLNDYSESLFINFRIFFNGRPPQRPFLLFSADSTDGSFCAHGSVLCLYT